MARTSAAACRRRPRSSSWSHNAAYRSSMARSSIIRPYIEATDALGTPSADPIQLPNQSRLFLRVALVQTTSARIAGDQETDRSRNQPRLELVLDAQVADVTV